MLPENHLNHSEITDTLSSAIKIFLAQNNSDFPVVQYYTPNELKNKMDCTLPNKPGNIKLVFEKFDEYLKYCVKTGHPQFFNQLWSGFNFPGFIGEVLTALTNTSMSTYESAPLATLIETHIITKFLSLAGFPKDGFGTFVTGGSNGNLLGMLVARNKFLENGHDLKQLCVFYSQHAHYSLDTAAMVLGISKSNIIKILCDEKHRININVLNQKMNEISQTGKMPFFICATAGTTVAGSFDNIANLITCKNKYPDCWLHVDAAHGGIVLLSQQYKHLLFGIELADSIVLDAHKILGSPLICSLFLIKQKDYLNFHAQESTAFEYLFHSKDEENPDLGTFSLQCGRRADCIKLWLMWTYYGTSGLETKVNRLMELANYAKFKVNSSKKFALVLKPEYVNICFYYKLEDTRINSDIFHAKLKEYLHKNGISMVNTAFINDKRCIRLVISNSDLNESDIDLFFDNLLAAAHNVINCQ